jgi:membrane associated rhomboid family serine protease
LLLWAGRIVERRVGIGQFTGIYAASALFSAAVILLFHHWHPKMGATVGASGGIFGLLGAALVIFYRRDSTPSDRLRTWLWIALLAGLTISFLPGISMAGHIGGLIGGIFMASVVKQRSESKR